MGYGNTVDDDDDDGGKEGMGLRNCFGDDSFGGNTMVVVIIMVVIIMVVMMLMVVMVVMIVMVKVVVITKPNNGFFYRHCCTTVLENATDGQTIAIPALGTGIYRVPHDVSAKSLVKAANEFLQENPTHALREVHFVDNNPAAVEALMKEMTTRFGHDPNFQINELVRDRWRSYLGAANDTSSSAPVVSSGDMAFKTPEGMEIQLTVGNIAKATVRDPSLDFPKSAVRGSWKRQTFVTRKRAKFTGAFLLR